MSKFNNTNQNNNGRNYNNNRGGNNNNRKKFVKQPKVNPNEIKAGLYLPANLDENIVNEIFDVLAATRFNKISIPVGVYRACIDNTVDENDNRVSTIGYIRGYNAETKEFNIIVFSKFIDIVNSLGDIAVELQFTVYKNALGTITKFNIIPVFIEEIVEE